MRRTVTVCVAALLLAGCGPKRAPSGTVKGTINYNGKPVNGAALQLWPAAGAKEAAFSIPVDQDGTFISSGVPPGEYKIVVEPSPGYAGPPTKGMKPEKLAEMKGKLDEMKTPATIPIPAKYKDAQKTDLKCTVGTGTTELTLELKG